MTKEHIERATKTAADFMDETGATLDPEPDPIPNGHDKHVDGFIDPMTWQGKPVPEREWSVNGWVPKGKSCLLAGDGGAGKSTLMQQLGTCMAIDRSWLGLPTRPGRALIVSCEDGEDDLHRRQEQINQFYGIDYRDLGGRLAFVDRTGRSNLLMAFERGNVGQLTQFFDDLADECRRFDPDFISLDPVADIYGGDENIRVQVRQFVQGCFGLLLRKCPRKGGRGPRP